MNAEILDPQIYERAKRDVYATYKKPSDFRSGALVKRYKELGGRYGGASKKKTALSRWFQEEWRDIGGKSYPVFRPTVRVNSKTPLTPAEIDPADLKRTRQHRQIPSGKLNSRQTLSLSSRAS